ncbi:pyruvate formate lyase family protein, partial [Lachnospiraceae bacterium OttesenSCG-928-E19]|nr:pyruvate formate lyase family protein [Lachnospiraceae bacterium OttesenSCG-928-E19]
MKERGMNERIQKLRAESLNTEASIDMARTKSMTKTYEKYEGSVSIPELRALVLKDYFSTKDLYLGDGELIVGEKGATPQACPTFPELCCHTLEDMHVMNDRELINFKVKEEDYGYQEKEVIPFWEKRSIRKRILDNMTQEWKDCYEAGLYTEFMEQRGPGH